MAETPDKKALAEAHARALAKQDLARVIYYQNVFSTDIGQKVLADLRKQHFFDKPTFIEQGSSEGMAYREGQRAVILRIDSMLKVDLEKLKERVEPNVKKA